ncbi:virulence factor SrfB, partial [Elioraea sp.]|uniref:virulence factor SrfB n=1 Tax=Elioraea sp. TaxID=2185103 RepID=UPI003F6EAA34
VDLDAASAPGEAAERPLPFSGRTFIGFKQFRAERWPASPLYCIEFSSAEAARGLMLPLKLMLKRTPPDAAQSDAAALFDVDDRVYDANDNPLIKPVRLRLQTLPGEGGLYWLDTGQLDTLDAILDALPG